MNYSGRFFVRNWRSLLLVFFLLISLPLTVPLAQKTWQYLIGAAYQPANLIISIDKEQGPLKRVWEGVAQGHEARDMRMNSASSLMKGAGVKYVRIDHVFNDFGVVTRGGDGRLAYNWTKLDQLVGDIVAAGATPFIVLSYMPPVISKSDILDMPNNWGEWGQVVAALVGHYSRDYRGGLPNMIYEVWNEPDLFGGWKMYGTKSYSQLYMVAANAASGVRGAKSFLIGGPATTGFYSAWTDAFYSSLANNTRIDFFSWHRYSADPADFVFDAKVATEHMEKTIKRTQRLFITEWGVNSERSKSYDGQWAAAHFLAVATALTNTNVDMALAFEVQDGGQPEAQFHGGWGMLTNPKYGAVVKKPRFRALELINRLQGNRLPIAGQGTFVTALSARDNEGVIRVMIVNYDPAGKNSEVVPVTFSGITAGTYSVTEEYMSGRKLTVSGETPGGMLRRDVILSPSDAMMMTVTKK